IQRLDLCTARTHWCASSEAIPRTSRTFATCSLLRVLASNSRTSTVNRSASVRAMCREASGRRLGDQMKIGASRLGDFVSQTPTTNLGVWPTRLRDARRFREPGIDATVRAQCDELLVSLRSFSYRAWQCMQPPLSP